MKNTQTKSMNAIIGGSGVYKIEGIKQLDEFKVQTPFGETHDTVKLMQLDGKSFYFITRHGKDHTVLPHEINYCANIFALKKLGVKNIISVSAVGSLSDDNPPGSFVLPDQFIDWTKGLRRRSFFGESATGHVSVADPVDHDLREIISSHCKNENLSYNPKGTYLCIEGPQFSTRAESKLYKSFGATIIGMTNVPEAFLAKEAGMRYSTIAMVTDWDGWKEEHCTLEEILKTMSANTSKVQQLVKKLIVDPSLDKLPALEDHKFSVMTKENCVTAEKQEVLDVLFN
jgi:5'-methylthioadenosine phosphorylase